MLYYCCYIVSFTRYWQGFYLKYTFLPTFFSLAAINSNGNSMLFLSGLLETFFMKSIGGYISFGKKLIQN